MSQSFESLRVDGPKLYVYDRKLIKSLNNLLTTPIIPESFHVSNYEKLNYKWFLSIIGDLTLDKLDTKRCSVSLDLLREHLTEKIKAKSVKSDGTSPKDPNIKKEHIEKYSDPLDKIHRINKWLNDQGIDKEFVEIERVSKKDIRYKLTIFVIHVPTKKKPIYLCGKENIKRVGKMIEDYEKLKKLSDIEEQNRELIRKIDALAYEVYKLTINNEFQYFLKCSDPIWQVGLENFKRGIKTLPIKQPRLGFSGSDVEVRKLVLNIIPFILDISSIWINTEGNVGKKEYHRMLKKHQIDKDLGNTILQYVTRTIISDWKEGDSNI